MTSVAIQGFHTDIASGVTLTPSQSFTAQWSITGIETGFDTCYLAVRPLSDLHSDGAVLAQAYPHPQCGAGSAVVVIPEQPLNASFPFDELQVIARLNTPYGLYSDSTLFILNKTYTPPWDRSEVLAKQANEIAQQAENDNHHNVKIALAGLIISIVSLVIGGIALGWKIWRN